MSDSLVEFANRILTAASESDYLDHSEIHDMAIECGLLTEVLAESPCGEGCICAECDDFPQTCYQKSDVLMEAE